MERSEARTQSAPVAAERHEARPLPPEIWCIQPGGGMVLRLELAWGRMRRWFLRRFRPGYVQRMLGLRRGHCPDCPHDVIDPRDLKYFRNCCGYYFPAEADRFAWRSRLGVARWGLAEAALSGGGLLLAGGLSAWWQPWLGAALALLGVGAVAFFRDPARRIPDGPGIVVAPADGKVDTIEELDHFEPIGGPAVKIGIFLSLFDVHLNRSPERCRVIELGYRRGRFHSATRRDAGDENEQMWMLLEQAERPHRLMFVRQIAGAVARRIVCEARPGQVLGRGEKYGMIKFGSRTELYLPREDGLCLQVGLNARVRAGASIVARYDARSYGSAG